MLRLPCEEGAPFPSAQMRHKFSGCALIALGSRHPIYSSWRQTQKRTTLIAALQQVCINLIPTQKRCSYYSLKIVFFLFTPRTLLLLSCGCFFFLQQKIASTTDTSKAANTCFATAYSSFLSQPGTSLVLLLARAVSKKRK